MAKESKGTRVKSFTAHVPTSAVEREKIVVPIYFRAKESKFAAWLPEHVAEAIGSHPEKPAKMSHGVISSPLVDEIEPSFSQAFELYERIQKNAAKKKVIQVFIEANHPYRNRLPAGVALKELSFARAPALSCWHRILYEIGDGLYRGQERDGDNMHLSYICAKPGPPRYAGGTQESFLLDWTPEREQFFDNMRNGLLTLIERIAFLLAGDTGGNVDKILAAGGGLLLPAPAAQTEER